LSNWADILSKFIFYILFAFMSRIDVALQIK
jgi:hypothetical protein